MTKTLTYCQKRGHYYGLTSRCFVCGHLEVTPEEYAARVDSIERARAYSVRVQRSFQ